uniref:C2H2-type domain-containing protein n=2 Tax=Amphiprion ocellaris TaxID=80972 RepID=A0A3Q1CS81_AMPOC
MSTAMCAKLCFCLNLSGCPTMRCGKRHAQKVKVYLQAKRAEKINKGSTGPQWTMTTDKDRFCELCNMVFSSHVVARSHYEGKVHTKNLRKQGLHPPGKNTEVHTLPSLAQDPDNSEQKSSPEGGTEHVLDPTATTATSSTEVDLKDPNKYCALCAASFNNPQMALQHYNGRKHQRNQARQELLRELGDDVQQAESLMCQMCSLQFNSVEMYQAHMQGNKHQIREKKVVDLCKSQQKVYGTFADELADYIQVQKARGITLKTNQVLAQGDTQREGEDDEEEDQEVLNEGDVIEPNKLMPNLPPISNPPHPSHPGSYYYGETCYPSYQGPPWASHGWSYSYPPPLLPHSGIPQFTGRPIKRRRHRKQSSSSSYSTSSSYSSYSSSSSSTNDSDDSEYRRREKKRIRRSRRERGRRGRDVESDKEERRRRKRRRRERVSEERRREQSVESEEGGKRKKLKNHGKHRRKEKKFQKENFEVEREERVTDKLQPEDVMENRKETEIHIQAEMDVEREDGQDEAAKPKFRKEKKKAKDKVDTRTEEEKLWDDSILGC